MNIYPLIELEQNVNGFDINKFRSDYEPLIELEQNVNDDEGDNMETKAQTFNRTRIECKS